MKNKIASIENDSEDFLQEVLKDNLQEEIEVYITLSKTSKQHNSFLNAQVYGYKYKEIPHFLDTEGILKNMQEVEVDHLNLGEKRWDTTSERILEYLNTPSEYRDKKFNNKLKGLFKIKFNKVTAEDWLEKRGIKIQTANLVQKDYVYENQQLKLTLLNGSTKSFDLSKAHVFRFVFESFFNLFNAGTDIFFDKNELLTEYKRITGKHIEWKKFIHIKSSYSNMIKDDPILKKRIIWQYVKSKNKNKYKFQILPLS